MKIIRDKKSLSKKRNRPTPPKPPMRLRGSDWRALMRHDRLTGKLNIKSKEVLKDPGSVKRLLEAAMIYPDGKLTPEAWKKCAVLAEKLQHRGALISADPKLPGNEKPAALPGKKTGSVSGAHWAVLLKYDRKTGNLLRIDPKTGQLDQNSRLILKNPSIIQRLVDENLILPGGWLTPVAKQGCVRIEKKIKALAQEDYSGPNPRRRRRSKDEPKPGIHSERKFKKARGLQVFFENLPHDVMMAAVDSGIFSAHYWKDEQELQAFFASLLDDVPEPDPETYFAYNWKDERDLQAYFANLPPAFSDAGSIARPGPKSALRAARSAGKSLRGVRSRNRQQRKKRDKFS